MWLFWQISGLAGYFCNVFGQFLVIFVVCDYLGLLWDVFVECGLLGLVFLRIVIAWGERSSLVLALGLAWSEDLLGDVRDFSSCLGCFMLFFACFLLFVEFFCLCWMLCLAVFVWALLDFAGKAREEGRTNFVSTLVAPSGASAASVARH